MNRVRPINFLVLVMCFASASSVALDLIPTSELDERVNAIADVNDSSSSLLAIVSDRLLDGNFQDLVRGFEARVPANSDVCVTYLTRNGRYTATQAFRSGDEGWAVVPFSPKETKILSALQTRTLVVRVLAGTDCQPPHLTSRNQPVLLPVRSHLDQSNNFSLIVHTDKRAARLRFRRKDEQKEFYRVDCDEIGRRNLTYFDKNCSFDRSKLESDAIVTLSVAYPDAIRNTRVNLDALSSTESQR